MARLALFDFDGTITTADTLFLFTASVVSPAAYWSGLAALSPMLVLHKLGLVSSQTTKERFLAWYLKGKSRADLEAQGEKFAKVIERVVRPMALERIREHRKNGDRVVVVSASADTWLTAWTAREGLELLATQLEYVDGKFTGRLYGRNCNGPEKVNRIRQHLDLTRYESIVVYGDSKGDREMLALGTETHYRPFRD